MANTIQIKRSAVPSKVPLTTDLALGELAVNTYDGKLFIKKNVSGTESVVEVGAGSAGGGSVTVSTTAPTSPTTGAMWWKSDEGIMLVYTGSVWVEDAQPLEGLALDLDGGASNTSTFSYTLDLGASV